MKKVILSLGMVSLITIFISFTACSKKDAPSPSTQFSESAEGSVTIDGATTLIYGGNAYSGNFSMYGKASENNYPYLEIRLGTLPSKDTTYSIGGFNAVSISVDNQNPTEDDYRATSGNIVVDVNADSFTATINNVTVANQVSKMKLISATLTYYY